MTEHDDLWRLVREVENSINTHRAECEIRNKDREKWEARREQWERSAADEISELKMHRAKSVAIVGVVVAIASAVGSAVVGAFFQQ